MSATTPVQEERAAAARVRALEKARGAKARKAETRHGEEARDRRRKLVTARRDADRLQARYDRVDLATEEALVLQSRLLGTLATIRRLEESGVSANPSTADLLSTLERIHREALAARHGFERGVLPTGRTALRRVEEEAADALVRAREKVAA